MPLSPELASIIVAGVGLIGSIIVSYFTANRQTTTKNHEIELANEHRFTVLEEKVEVNKNQFKDADRELLNVIKREIDVHTIQLGFLWDHMKSDAALGLKNPVALDGVLERIAYEPLPDVFKDLSPEVKTQLFDYLDASERSRSSKKRERARIINGMIRAYGLRDAK